MIQQRESSQFLTDSKVHKAIRDLKVHKDHRAMRVFKDHKDLQERTELMVLTANRVLKDLLVLMALTA